ncbi:MAG: phospholipase D-like domain-containing protein [Christensenellales bacterium]
MSCIVFCKCGSITKEREDDLSRFYPNNLLQSRSELSECNTDGLVQPYADSPADKENVGEHVYLEVIGSSKKYLYITTPYLIIDDTMLSALKLAAKSGVDVVLITPHIWDAFVHLPLSHITEN